MNEEDSAHLKNMARDMQSIKSMLAEVITYMKDAESEVSEKMRRFIMYAHDVHDMQYMYESRGIPVPPHVMREIERCDDRYRHLLEDIDNFEKIRTEMSKRSGNRWDWSRQLAKPKETTS